MIKTPKDIKAGLPTRSLSSKKKQIVVLNKDPNKMKRAKANLARHGLQGNK